MVPGRRSTLTTMRLVVAMGCRGETVARCRLAVPPGTLVRQSAFVDVAARILRWRPLAVVVPRELYDLDPPAFDMVAERAMTSLVPLPRDDVPADALRCVIAHAIRSAEVLRASAC